MPEGRPTLDTVAAEAGVSRMTVSNAYNRPDQLSPQTRERVLAAAVRVGYAGPDPTAASLRRGNTATVGVVLTEQLPYAFADPGMVTILHGIAAELSAAGHALLLVPAAGPGNSEPGALLRRVMVDALILCSIAPDDPAVSAALDRQLPVVMVGSPKLPKVPNVGADNHSAAALVAEHLYRLGHRRVAVLTHQPHSGTGPRRPGFQSRTEGFRAALLERGVPADHVTVHSAERNDRDAGAAAAAELLAVSPRPTAIFAVTDILALGVIDASIAAGIAVPDELSVAGFDDIPAAATNVPSLTTVAHALYEQGVAAARLALRRIAGERVRPPRLPAELVVRGSTARAARAQ
jgi:DNA-binding LacI/PurR family transcriptional regulator